MYNGSHKTDQSDKTGNKNGRQAQWQYKKIDQNIWRRGGGVKVNANEVLWENKQISKKWVYSSSHCSLRHKIQQ